jgi:hypothetical protein
VAFFCSRKVAVMTASATLSPAEIIGSTTPRVWTPPLVTGPPGPCGCGCALTEDTSYGFDAVNFVEKRLKRTPWPWQRWLYIHGGELLADGSTRFRRLVVTVGRQSGKTRGVEDLSLYWMFEDQVPSILGTSTLTKYAKKPWASAFELACSKLAKDMPADPRRKAVRKAAGEEEWWNRHGAHYAIAASNSEGGRSMANERVIADELAKQYNYDAYGAAYYSMESFDDAQWWGLTTPDPLGIVYTDLRQSALEYIDTGVGDPALALFEWSAPPGAKPTDLQALAMANPTMGLPGGKRPQRMHNEASAAVARGGLLLRTFQTEIMCLQLEDEEAVISKAGWRAGNVPGDLGSMRSRVALVFDVAPSLLHATLYAAAELDDGRVRVDAVEAWEGPGCTDRAVRALPALVARSGARAFGWLPSGPAAAVGAKLAARDRPGGAGSWPPRGVVVSEIRGELSQVCMGFSALVAAKRVLHGDDPLLNDNVDNVEKFSRGDGAWVFSRKGDGDVDALYAAAGAAHLARIMPKPVGAPRVILPKRR